MGIFRATFMGTIGSVEVFAFGWAHSSNATAAVTDLADLSTWLTTYLDTTVLSSTPRASYPTTIKFTKIRNQLYQAGNVVDSAELAINQSGTGASGTLPLEVSMCVSLPVVNSGFTPPIRRGRFYLPPLQYNMIDAGATSLGIYDANTMTRHVTALKAAWDAFVTPGTRDLGVARHIKNTVSQFAPLTVFNIGNVPDSQRRRRNRLVEVRTSATIV